MPRAGWGGSVDGFEAGASSREPLLGYATVAHWNLRADVTWDVVSVGC